MKARELACVRMMVSTRSGLTSLRGCGKCVLSPLLFSIFFAAVTHAVVARFNEDPDIVRDLVHLEEDLEENAAGVSPDPLACVCLLYTSPSPRDKRQSRMPSSA